MMDLDKAAELSRNIMAEHGLDDWTFGFDNAKRRCGQCSFTKRRITMSRYYVELNDWTEVRNTVLHEVAHALAGNAAGHGPAWRVTARSIGAKPERCAVGVTMPEGKWRGSCDCGAASQVTRHRIVKGTYFCRICGSNVTWMPNTD
jgi:predicted SprT family Zn-dependent metalloprotease